MSDPAAHLDLGALSLRGGERYSRDFRLEMTPIVLGGQRYDVVLPEDVLLVVNRVAGGFLVGVSVKAKVYGPCARCLDEVVAEVQAEQQEFVPTSKEGWEETELSAFVDGVVVDVAGLAREAVVLALPARVICSDDCRGLCPQCGQDLNVGECACGPAQLDDRWSKLKDVRLEE